MTVKVGVEVPIQVDRRYVQHQRDQAIRDVYDALPEIITNADDSYSRLFRHQKRADDGGDILIEYCEQRRGNRSYLVIRDQAEGMNATDMERYLARLGAYSSEEGDRGYMGRGAKDCAALGDVIFESIKDGAYYRSKITNDLKFILEVDRAPATEGKRKELGLPRGNGTSVTLLLSPSHTGARIPRFKNLAADLPWHFALRDITAQGSPSKVLLRRANAADKPRRLVYRPPEGELLIEETFQVLDYPSDARATLRIWRASDVLEDARNGPRFERFGILVKGERAIHECSLLADEFKKDVNGRRYFGRLDCPYIDRLLQEYEDRRAKGSPHPPENPRLLLDPNRRYGLDREHPFIKALFQVPIELLRALIARDREGDPAGRREIANRETQARLDRLAKFAGSFLREQLEEEEIASGESVDEGALTKQGILIYPTYARVSARGERTLTIYARGSALDGHHTAVVESGSETALVVVGSPVTLQPHSTKDDLVRGYFRIRGLEAGSTVVLTAKCGDLTAEGIAEVVSGIPEDRDFASAVEFEHEQYTIRLNERRSARVFARYPDVVAEPATAKLWTDDGAKVVLRGGCTLTPIAGTNYAEGRVNFEGRVLNAKTHVHAEVNGRRATANVIVVDKTDRSVPIKIEFRDEDYGNYRAIWADREGKPNLLLVSARHKSISRYLGPPNEFPGQNTPLFRALLAEIVAESVCRKLLVLDAKEHPWQFRWADLKDDEKIADDVLAKMQRLLRDFLPKAHSIMLADSEVRAAQRNGATPG